MINNLFETLPNSIFIDGKEYKVDMSFDNVLNILAMLKDERLNDSMKILTGLQMLFEEVPEYEFEQLILIWQSAFENLVGGKEEVETDIKGNPMPKKKTDDQEKVFDFHEDAQYIYASFYKDYKIDLFEVQGKLHWYKFNSLLNGLSEDTKLRKVIEIRQSEYPKGKENAKKRSELRKLKKVYELKGSD